MITFRVAVAAVLAPDAAPAGAVFDLTAGGAPVGGSVGVEVWSG